MREAHEHTASTQHYEDSPNPTTMSAHDKGFTAGRLTCMAATINFGTMVLPAVVFRFHADAETTTATLVLTPDLMAEVPALVDGAVRGAMRAAAQVSE